MDSAAFLEQPACKYWQTKGSEQKDSERYLKTQLMLAGFALENILKALIVQDQGSALDSEFSSKGKLPKVLKSHDLVDLAKHARLELGDDMTKSLLGRLTRHSVWAGRYPMPIWPHDLPAEDFFNIRNPSLVCVAAYIKQDWQNTQSLFHRAKQIIERRNIAKQHDTSNPHSPSVQGADGR